MIRARKVIPRQTAARVERLRNLINALLLGELAFEEIGDILQVGPSGVRKYLTNDLANKVEVARRIDSTPTFAGFPVYRITITAAQAEAYLAGLAVNASARAAAPRMSVSSVVARDPSRHFHILADDTHYSVRVSRTPPMRDPMVAAFFGAGRHEVRA